MDTDPHDRPPLGHAVDQELHLLDAAMELVRARPGERVVLGGLRFGEDLIRLRGQQASRMGLALEPLWSLDEVGCDVRIRATEVAR